MSLRPTALRSILKRQRYSNGARPSYLNSNINNMVSNQFLNSVPIFCSGFKRKCNEGHSQRILQVYNVIQRLGLTEFDKLLRSMIIEDDNEYSCTKYNDVITSIIEKYSSSKIFINDSCGSDYVALNSKMNSQIIVHYDACKDLLQIQNVDYPGIVGKYYRDDTNKKQLSIICSTYVFS